MIRPDRAQAAPHRAKDRATKPRPETSWEGFAFMSV